MKKEEVEILKKKLADNKVDEVIDELLKVSRKSTENYNQSILVQSKYKEYKKNLIIGIENSNSELQKIKYGMLKLIDEIAKQGGSEKPNTIAALTKIDKIKLEFNITDVDTVNLIFQIGESNHKWRKGKTLELKMGVSDKELASISRNNPEIIERGQSNTGEILYKLKPKYDKLYKAKIF